MSMTIGIDPHKGSHTAVAIDGDEHPIARLTVTADRCQTQRLLAWAEPTRDTCLMVGEATYRPLDIAAVSEPAAGPNA